MHLLMLPEGVLPSRFESKDGTVTAVRTYKTNLWTLQKQINGRPHVWVHATEQWAAGFCLSALQELANDPVCTMTIEAALEALVTLGGN